MTTMPLVSVVVATNRGGEFLDEALRSVVEQSYPRWELIVVDDGSAAPDAIADVVARHRGVRLVRQEPAGVSVARNVGVAESNGVYCAFLDDDDLWTPDRLALQVAALEAEPGAVLAYGRVAGIDAEGRVVMAGDQSAAPDIHAVFDGRRVPQFQSALIRRRSLVRVGGFHSGLRLAEDLDLILRLARDGRFVFVDAELAQYRRHATNVTAAYRPLAKSVDAVARLHAVRAELDGDGTLHDLRARRRANGRYALWRAASAARSSSARDAIAHLVWAVRFAPLAPFDAALRRLRGRR